MPTTTPVPTSTNENYYVSSAKEKEDAEALANAANKDRVTHDEFLKLLTTQLTHQDPLNPMQDTEFMGQMAQLQALDEQIAMTRAMQAMRLDSQLRTGNELLGQVVTGTNAAGSLVSGMVGSVSVRDGELVLKLAGGGQLPFENVSEIREATLEEMMAE